MQQTGKIVIESKEKVYGNLGNDDVINLVPKNIKYILDIGCGNGSTAKHLIAKNYIVDGITLSENEKSEAEKIMRHVYIYNLENGLPFKESNLYDVIICSHVLEHICYPKKLMTDIYSVLKPGGTLIVALPNIMHYSARWKLIKGNFNYEDAGIWDYTHFRWYTFETAKQFLQQYNFTIEVATVTGTLPFNRLFKRILPLKISFLFFSILIKISKGLFGYQLLFKALKK